MFKKAKIIMLPTEDRTNIIINKSFSNKSILQYRPDLIKASEFLRSGWKNQHLYITTDDEIKEGDWFLDETNILKNTLKDLEYELIGKIIATTDTSLYQHAIHSEGRIKIGLHQIPQSFIQEYYKIGGINEVLVEYITKRTGEHRSIGNIKYHGPKVNLDDTINIKPVKTSWTKDEIISFILSDDFPFVSPLDYVEKDVAIKRLKELL